ncbi:hypothetical protein PTKIN_Ptkin14bG0128100 [Pterospermum kingtungense]
MERVIRILCLLLAVLHFLVDLSWSFSSSFLPSSHLCLPDQKVALLEFKNTIPLLDYCETYPKTNSWNKSTDCCSWREVSCDKMTGHVIGINLSDSCLYGSLLANNSLFDLRNLQWLDLSSNQLEGSLLENSSLFHLQGLQRLNLAANFFKGSISSEIFTQLVSLTHLDLSHSGFSGLIPYQIGLLSNLVSLDLSFSSPSRLRFDAQGFDMLTRNLTKLKSLVLDGVDMSGVATTSFLNLSSSLEHLSLKLGELHGEFPSEVFQLPYLQHIGLGLNIDLSGYLPKKNLSTALKVLDLQSCRFKGSIPASFANLTQLISIDLTGNSFEGQIPDVFGNLNKLTHLTFAYCNFSGQLPITMFNLTKITQLILSHNQLEGSLPNDVSELQLLELFFLSNNFISGRVPSWLFTLPSLYSLHLDSNKLTGPIDEIQKPNSVVDVDLSSNDIHGPLTSSFFDLVSLSILDLSSNNLSGVIKVNMLSKLTSLRNLDLSNNSLLSLSTSGNDVNHSFPELVTVSFSSCSIRQFPNFFRTSRLEVLDLSNNKISGVISKWETEGWEQLNSLNLSNNFLTTLEEIPGKSLDTLDLHSNLLQGPIKIPNPPQFLREFFISENKLSGNVPSSICNCSSLVALDFSKNSLTGTIPECLGNFSSIDFINLQMNNFHGKIPDSFMKHQLEILLLNDNQLEGLVPRSLANCSSLKILNLGNNKLTDTFPHWLGSLPSLQVLSLRFNSLHGLIPDTISSSNFSALRIVDLSRNDFSGPLSTKFFRSLSGMKILSGNSSRHDWIGYEYQPQQISVSVTSKGLEIEFTKTLAILIAMDFSENLFSGQIPQELGELISLQVLNFSHNNLTGPIPQSLGNMVALESLDLSSNKLGGRIPSELTNLTFLAKLNLSKNDLIGPVPRVNQFATFDNDSYSGNLGLCGFPLSKLCSNSDGPNPPQPMLKEDEGSGIAFIWKLAMMGYGCGLVLGLSIGYIVFTTGRPWWFVRMVERDLQRNVSRWIRRIQGRRN